MSFWSYKPKEQPNLADDKYSILYCRSKSEYKPDYVWDDDERSCSAIPVRKYNSFIESDENTKSLAQIMKEYYDEERSFKYNNNNNNHSQESDIYYGNQYMDPPIIYSPDLPKSSESAQVDTDMDDNHVESTDADANTNEDGEDDNTKNKFYDDIIYKKFYTS